MKRPDGLTSIPWQAGEALTWDVTVVCPFASAAQDAGAVAELAAARKTADVVSVDGPNTAKIIKKVTQTTVTSPECQQLLTIKTNLAKVSGDQYASSCQISQEAQLSPSDRAMRLVSSNLASYHATVQKLLIRQVLTKPMV